MTEEQKALAVQMAREGKAIASISEKLGVTYWEVHAHVTAVGALSWLGAKRSITNRLNKLKRERDQAAREQLVSEASELVNYIYYSGKNLGKKIDSARRTLRRVHDDLGE